MTYDLVEKQSLEQVCSKKAHAILGLFGGIWNLCVRDSYLVFFVLLPPWQQLLITLVFYGDAHCILKHKCWVGGR